MRINTHDRKGRRLGGPTCALCDDAFAECSKCGIYTCTCAHFVACVSDSAP